MWRSTLSGACVCPSPNQCLSTLVTWTNIPLTSGEWSRVDALLLSLSRVCLPDPGSQWWDGGLRALEVLKHVVSNPKDEGTRTEYRARKPAGRLAPSSAPMEVAILKYVFVLFWESTFLVWVVQDCNY